MRRPIEFNQLPEDVKMAIDGHITQLINILSEWGYEEIDLYETRDHAAYRFNLEVGEE